MQVTRFPSRAEGPAERVAGFVAHLRMNGFRVGPDEVADCLRALTLVEATDQDQARKALGAVLIPDADRWRLFDELFEAYWYNAGKTRQQDRTSDHVRSQSKRPSLWQSQAEQPGAETQDDTAPSEADNSAGDEDRDGVDGRLMATKMQNLRKRDLREVMDETTLRQAEQVAQKLGSALRDRRTRRRKRAQRGSRFDMRRIQRASLARGGDPVELFRMDRAEKPLRVVAICDVSGSMTVYARVFLAFLKGMVGQDTKTDAYLFHVKLLRISDALREQDTLKAAARLSLMAEGFGGGTDIGGCLASFVQGYGAKALNSRTVVVVLSDGYCSGAPERLADSLAKIKQKSRRIVWLNPLKGWDTYAPIAASMQAASPYLDAHLPANTLEALAALEHQFERL
ncbi:MAG: VWA domain-containing protein [Thalassovita sp.]